VELQLPTGTTDHTTTISPKQLEGANGYQSKFFFTNKTDGSMSFWDSENGVTLGSKFPRTELREAPVSSLGDRRRRYYLASVGQHGAVGDAGARRDGGGGRRHVRHDPVSEPAAGRRLRVV
jgi:hypothetical protein